MPYQPTQGPTPQVIETASATTSPDNANSGSQAYIIAAAALLALILISSVMGGCVSAAFKSVYYLVEDDMLSTDWEYVLEEYGTDPYVHDDLDGLFGELFDEGNQA